MLPLPRRVRFTHHVRVADGHCLLWGFGVMEAVDPVRGTHPTVPVVNTKSRWIIQRLFYLGDEA